MDYSFLLDLCAILLATKLLGLASRWWQLPQVVGALVAGLLLGPVALGALTKSIWGTAYCLEPTDAFNMLAELGVVVMMFSAGTETSVRDLRQSGKAGLIVATCGVIVPLVMGVGIVYLFDPNAHLVPGLFLGAVLTATSVSITVETLKELGKLSSKSGNTILAAALIDDILGLICLTLVTGLAGANVSIGWVFARILGFFVFVLVMGFFWFRFMRWSTRETGQKDLKRYPLFAFALCLFMAYIAEAVFGVADIIGAFSAGMIVSVSRKGRFISQHFDPLSFLFLTPVFFANIGVKVVMPELSGSILVFTLVLIAVAVASKFIGCGLGAKLSGFSNKECVRVGVGMVCRGEVAIIVANQGVALGLIPQADVGPIIIMIVVCTIVTPILLKRVYSGSDEVEHENAISKRFELPDQAAQALDTLTQ